jgi:hypothetical protein
MSNNKQFTLRRGIYTTLLSVLLYSSGLSQDARLIARTTFPSVVMLEMQDDKNQLISLGSGFFVRPNIIATNYHVIAGASKGVAKIIGNTSIYQIEGVVEFDKEKDIALLKVNTVTGKPLILADISKIEVGQEIFALGNPKGLEGTISPGIISGSTLRGFENLIQITAPISEGSSGGPVVNKKGEVIGIAVATLKDGQNLNFAIPSAYLALLLAKNSKNVTNLTKLTQELKTPPQTDSEPSLSETTAWITEKLLLKVGRPKGSNVLEKNERIVFDNCAINVVTTMQSGIYLSKDISFANFSDFRIATLNDDESQVIVIFVDDSVFNKSEEYEERSLVKSVNYRNAGITLWVGDKQLGLRVIKAFERLAKLCKIETKKEPF